MQFRLARESMILVILNKILVSVAEISEKNVWVMISSTAAVMAGLKKALETKVIRPSLMIGIVRIIWACWQFSDIS